jgi:hypothetical protein
MTFGYWIYITTYGSNPVSFYKDTFSNNLFIQPDTDSGIIRLAVALPTQWTAQTSFSTTYLNIWTHVAYTVSQTSPYLVQLYVNGVFRGSGNGTGPPIGSLVPNFFVIGRSSEVAGRGGWSGGIRHVFIYNSILTASEIQAVYNATI